MIDQPTSLLRRLLACVVSIFDKAEPVVDQLVTLADDLFNVIKAAEAIYPIQLLEDGIETVLPGSAPLFKTFKSWLPRVCALLACTDTELNKTDQEKLQDLLKYLNVLKSSEPVLYIGVHKELNAAIQQFFSTNQRVSLSIPQSLFIAQVVYDSALGTNKA